MKNLKFFTYLLIIISTSFFVRCTPENVDYGATTKQMITKVQWSVDYYFAGQDKTAQFNRYKFSFIGNGAITADDGTNAVTGSWRMLTDVNRNDVLQINISEVHLQDLNSQWTVLDLTSTGLLIMKGRNTEIRFRKL
jgi:hypothetical protein